jgi:hypothetical protein
LHRGAGKCVFQIISRRWILQMNSEKVFFGCRKWRFANNLYKCKSYDLRGIRTLLLLTRKPLYHFSYSGLVVLECHLWSLFRNIYKFAVAKLPIPLKKQRRMNENHSNPTNLNCSRGTVVTWLKEDCGFESRAGHNFCFCTNHLWILHFGLPLYLFFHLILPFFNCWWVGVWKCQKQNNKMSPVFI